MQAFFNSPRNRSWLLLAFSTLSLLILIARAVFLLISGLLAFSRSSITSGEMGPFFLEALSMTLCSALLLPLMITSIRQLQGKKLPAKRVSPGRLRIFLILAIAWVVVLTAASLLTASNDFGWLLAAPAFLLGILIPVLAITWIAAGGLLQNSYRRIWAAFSLGMTGGTGLALLLEYSLVLFAVIVFVIVMMVRPELASSLEQIQALVETAGNTEQLLSVLAPWLVKPWIFLLLLAFIAVIGPLIEEAVKPLAVWFLGRRLQSPGEGFALGALSGAGFALLEGLLAASGYASQPVFGLPARLASSMMHITLSAFMGWAIASAFLGKRWSRLVISYLLCAALHGLWNGSALLAVYGALRFSITGAAMPDILSSLFMLVGVSMLFVTFISITLGLPLMNLRLRKLQGDIIAQPKNLIERMKDGVDPQSG